jgi:hypothetical protein
MKGSNFAFKRTATRALRWLVVPSLLSLFGRRLMHR